MKLEKIYKYVDKDPHFYRTPVTYSRYADVELDDDEKDMIEITEGYFITREQLWEIISDSYYDGGYEDRHGSCEDYTRKKLKEIEK